MAGLKNYLLIAMVLMAIIGMVCSYGYGYGYDDEDDLDEYPLHPHYYSGYYPRRHHYRRHGQLKIIQWKK